MARTAKTGSEIVADAQERLKERGGSRFPTLTLSPEETALWERLVEAQGGPERGRAKRTLVAALNALDGAKEPTNAQLLAILKGRLK